MQHEKRTLWVVQGCFFNSTCFCPLTVRAVRFLCTERQSVERTKYEIYAFICLEVQQTCLFKMCHMCMKIHACLDLSLWFQTKTWWQDWNPRGRGSTSIQNRETRQEIAKHIFSKLLLMTTWCCEGMVWQYHNSKVSEGQKECTSPLLETPSHLCSSRIVSPLLLAWHLS